MLNDEARMTRAALYDMGGGRQEAGDNGYSESEIYRYANECHAVLTFEIAQGLAQLVHAGEVHVSAYGERHYRLTEAGAQAEEAFRLRQPTTRQVQLLERLERGLSPEDIATELGMSSRTVRMQIVLLLQLFNVEKRSELLAAWKLVRDAGPGRT